MKTISVVGASMALTALLAGCQSMGEQYASNVYTAGQVDSRQAAETVQILAVLPAKVKVDNSQNKRAAEVAGGILGALVGGIAGANTGRYRQTNAVLGAGAGGVAGAAAGSLVSDTTLVNGVSIAYKEDGKVYNSAQVGKTCQFAPGTAIMISTGPDETRIQPNATCPPSTDK